MRSVVLAIGLGAVSLGLAGSFMGCAGPAKPSPAIVGRLGPNEYFTATGQLLTPAGRQVEFPGMRPQALALSSDGTLLAVAGKKHTLALVDPANGEVLQSVLLSIVTLKTNGPPTGSKQAEASKSGSAQTNKTEKVTTSADLSFTGLVFSPDDRRVFLSNAGGDVWSYPVVERRIVGPPIILSLSDAATPKQKKEIPSGLAISSDGRRLYVVGNLGNRLYELATDTGKVLRSWPTGVAPYDIVFAGTKAYVSNQGGRVPHDRDLTASGGMGTTVLVDPVRDIASEGSVTVIDLAGNRVCSEIPVGLHASGLAAAPDGKHVVVANTGSDTLSVIEVASDRVVEKIWARISPGDLFGAQPDALTFSPDGGRLFVCNGTQNAVAIIRFEPAKNASILEGLIPVGWFPGAVAFDAKRRNLCVANIKGVGALKVFKTGEKVKMTSKDFFGTVSIVPVPTRTQLADMTQRAKRNMRYPRLAEVALPARPGQPARAVPERVGEPSLFKHVIYVIKENRTYDQILGDMPEGNGDASLCTFGEEYTPNQHRLARDFVLLDNTYCSGICSGDGHQWTDSALANDYVERQLTADSPRSYSGSKGVDAVDALSWASSGFIWNNALAHGKSVRNYGEWMLSDAAWRDRKRKEAIQWQDFYKDFLDLGNATQLRCHPGLESLRAISNTNTVGWDLRVPDVMRAAEFIRELHQFETNHGLPDLCIVFLPNDHTGGAKKEYPTPGAQIADNDLAFGRLVEALSHSSFWPETCLFAIEDDSQAGWDHVSGYRTTCYVVSPYTKHRQTVSVGYNQTSLMHTIELILGLPPMNQMDATASPMAECFTTTPDFTPFVAVTNQIPLDTINPEPKKVTDRRLRRDALLSGRLPLDQPDRCPEDVLNRILWRAMKGADAPYPDWAVKLVKDDD